MNDGGTPIISIAKINSGEKLGRSGVKQVIDPYWLQDVGPLDSPPGLPITLGGGGGLNPAGLNLAGMNLVGQESDQQSVSI